MDGDGDTDGLDIWKLISGQPDFSVFEFAKGFGCILE
jgi:hypothetical protein